MTGIVSELWKWIWEGVTRPNSAAVLLGAFAAFGLERLYFGVQARIRDRRRRDRLRPMKEKLSQAIEREARKARSLLDILETDAKDELRKTVSFDTVEWRANRLRFLEDEQDTRLKMQVHEFFETVEELRANSLGGSVGLKKVPEGSEEARPLMDFLPGEGQVLLIGPDEETLRPWSLLGKTVSLLQRLDDLEEEIEVLRKS